jgi:hypothetical protein
LLRSGHTGTVLRPLSAMSRFNAAGKADLMYSFAEQPQPPKK